MFQLHGSAVRKTTQVGNGHNTNRVSIKKCLEHIRNLPSKTRVKQYHWATLHQSPMQETSYLCQSNMPTLTTNRSQSTINDSANSKQSMQENVKEKPFSNHRVHRLALMSVFVAFSQKLAYTTRPQRVFV